jgi:hypothetical protein
VYKTFELLEKGYAIGSTMHAETVQDVIAILDSDPLNVPARWIARLTLVINLYVSSTYGYGPAVRRFYSVHMLEPDDGGEGEHAGEHTGEHAGEHTGGANISRGTIANACSSVPGVRPILLSQWDRASDRFMHCFHLPEVQARLAAWAGLSTQEWAADVSRRRAYLHKMAADGVRGISATRAALRQFRA